MRKIKNILLFVMVLTTFVVNSNTCFAAIGDSTTNQISTNIETQRIFGETVLNNGQPAIRFSFDCPGNATSNHLSFFTNISGNNESHPTAYSVVINRNAPITLTADKSGWQYLQTENICLNAGTNTVYVVSNNIEYPNIAYMTIGTEFDHTQSTQTTHEGISQQAITLPGDILVPKNTLPIDYSYNTQLQLNSGMAVKALLTSDQEFILDLFDKETNETSSQLTSFSCKSVIGKRTNQGSGAYGLIAEIPIKLSGTYIMSIRSAKDGVSGSIDGLITIYQMIKTNGGNIAYIDTLAINNQQFFTPISVAPQLQQRA